MISPQNRQVETAVSRPDSRTVLYLSLALAIIITIGLILIRIMFTYNNEPLLFGSFDPLIILIIWVNVWLVWRGRVLVGTGLLTLTFWGIIATIITQRADMGLMLTISAAFFAATLLTYAWPQRLRLITGLVMTLASLALILLDLFWPVARPSIPRFMLPIYLTATISMILVVSFLVIRRFPTYSLRGKLIATFLAITGIPLVAMSLGNYWGLRSALTDSANQTLLSASSQTAVTLDDFFHGGLDTIGAEAIIIGAAYDWAYFDSLTEEERIGPVGTLAEQKAISLLIAYRNRDPEHIASYALLDLAGNVLFEYPRPDSQVNESGYSFFTQVMETGTVYASPVEFSPETGQPYFHFSAVVVDGVGKQVGVLRARYQAEFLQELIDRSTGLVGGESFAVLFDENNLHLAHGGDREAVYKLVDLPAAQEITALQAINRLPNEPASELTTDLPKLEQLLNDAASNPVFEAVGVGTADRVNQVGVAFMQEQPWKVAYFQPQDVFLAPETTLIRRTVLMAMVALAAVAGVAVAVANLIAQPILQLEEVANQVAQGELTVQAPEIQDNEAGALARTFNMMTAQIRDLVANLENRVAERTRALEISNQISQKLSTILDQPELVATAVNQVQDGFDYYHAHIYLFDEAGENLVMVGGTGPAGETMLKQGHKIGKGVGLVGRASELNTPVLVSDVAQAQDWLPNPLLPDTKAEIAVPIALGDQVLGVLDVQDDNVGGLDETDVDVLQIVANQVAIALQNARLYAQVQQNAAQQVLVHEISQQIQQTDSVETALQVAVRELGRATGAPSTQVRLTVDESINGRTPEGKI